ncbi:arrestin domain-containing protein 3-like [Boleophthalmus pectinirostris]|uniref:arrestin domain-containing protein 3-like n=1 Tax=Boleophthalmus pectinirostris TaxID=150288 RepID=UPI00242BC771|nr:arrestin domain-containing protein 3-like [Boleophthalmus pectinirostris]
MTIKTLTVEYDPSRETSGFSRGETITGRVVLELDKDTTIKCFSVTAKGEAFGYWIESSVLSYSFRTYTAKEHLFLTTKILLEPSRPGSKVLSAGRHVFPFALEIPDIDLPQRWEGFHGSIDYTLEARVSRFMRLDCKERIFFTIASNDNYSNPDIMKPQQVQGESKTKSSSRKFELGVTTEKTGYLPGEDLEITTRITNKSKDTKVTPRYVFYGEQSVFSKDKKKIVTKSIVEEKGNPVQPGQQVTQTKVLQIPEEVKSTILSCNIIKQEYRLKVYLDGLQHSPEANLPIIVL